MKSVGEVMSIGRTFEESLQKALRSMETGLTGLDDVQFEGLGQGDDKNVIRAAIGQPTPDRLLKVAQALRLGMDPEQVHQGCKIDPWFIRASKAHHRHRRARQGARAAEVGRTDARPQGDGLLGCAARKAFGQVGSRGADAAPKPRRSPGIQAHRYVRGRVRLAHALHVFDYERALTLGDDGKPSAPSCEASPSAREKIVILGGGPNRIGQGIEFDYCCCHACFSLTKAGYETIMVNCNPETVSTDYDTSDRLYFEPLTAEDVLEIIRREQSSGTVKGVIVQFGGQTPLKLAAALAEAGVPILGTSPDAIDLAEDRDRFKELIEKLKLRQPESGIAAAPGEAAAIADRIGYPVVIRPSYVLGGRAMEIVHDGSEVERYITRLSATLDRPSELVCFG